MIAIKKQQQPAEWTEKCATPNAVYEAIPALRDALLKEQGYICAYCMRQIPASDHFTDTTSKIDHLKSQEKYSDLQLSYNNMVACCPGKITNDAHCDTKKGESSISFTFGEALEKSISYSTNGKIESSNATWNKEINEVLNLNHALLKMNRKNTLEGVIYSLSKGQWSQSELRRKLEEWSNLDKNGKRKPYCGIVITFLKKKLTKSS